LEYIPPSIELAARLIDATTTEQQVNAAGKVLDKILENLTELAKDALIDIETLLKILNGLSVNKNFSKWRGNLKSLEIRLGSE